MYLKNFNSLGINKYALREDRIPESIRYACID